MAGFRRNPAFVREWIEENGPRWEMEVGAATAAAIQAAAPYQTGFLKTTIESTPIGGAQPRFRVSARADYAAYVDQGTGLYGPDKKYITPRVAKALSWIADGQRVYAKRVRGQPGQRFFLTGLTAIFGDNVEEHRYGRGGAA